MTLANEIENGGGSDEEFLLRVGCTKQWRTHPVDRECGPQIEYWYYGEIQLGRVGHFLPLTSVDDALALLEAVLPGWKWALDSDGNAQLYSSIKRIHDDFENASAWCPNRPAAALCAAILRAKEAG